jgi:hypothetical protein
MKRKNAWLIVAGLAAGVMLLGVMRRQEPTSPRAKSKDRAELNSQSSAEKQSAVNAATVPAHYETTPPLSSLAVTLAPDKFNGKTREAYQVAREIPQTIAQLPCYCYCDRGMGHKSLHSCFEDDHAAHCAVCTDEALMAYRLQKQGLTPKRIRERIIEEFSGQ